MADTITLNLDIEPKKLNKLIAKSPLSISSGDARDGLTYTASDRQENAADSVKKKIAAWEGGDLEVTEAEAKMLLHLALNRTVNQWNTAYIVNSLSLELVGKLYAAGITKFPEFE